MTPHSHLGYEFWHLIPIEDVWVTPVDVNESHDRGRLCRRLELVLVLLVLRNFSIELGKVFDDKCFARQNLGRFSNAVKFIKQAVRGLSFRFLVAKTLLRW